MSHNQQIVQKLSLPKVLLDHPGWEFFKSVRDLKDISTDNPEEDNVWNASKITLLNELGLIGNTRCAACGGYGHPARTCPTNTKLTLLGRANRYSTTYIAMARKSAVGDISLGHSKLPPNPHSKVPGSILGKRTHARR